LLQGENLVLTGSPTPLAIFICDKDTNVLQLLADTSINVGNAIAAGALSSTGTAYNGVKKMNVGMFCQAGETLNQGSALKF